MRNIQQSLTVTSVMEVEQQRVEALLAGDIQALRELLAPDLTHTHSRGVTDTLDSYLHFVQHDIRFIEIQRENMQVRLIGTAAIMDGNQLIRLQSRGMAESIISNSRVLQVWAWKDDQWLLHAFQSTTLSDEPIDTYSSYTNAR